MIVALLPSADMVECPSIMAIPKTFLALYRCENFPSSKEVLSDFILSGMAERVSLSNAERILSGGSEYKIYHSSKEELFNYLQSYWNSKNQTIDYWNLQCLFNKVECMGVYDTVWYRLYIYKQGIVEILNVQVYRMSKNYELNMYIA